MQMSIPINRDNLRDLLLAVAIVLVVYAGIWLRLW